MKPIPEEYRHFYSEGQLRLRDARIQAEEAHNRTEQYLRYLGGIEKELIDEALETIADRGLLVHVTDDVRLYETHIGGEDNRVYLLCDETGHLRDMKPLLPFASQELRAEYESLRNREL